MMELACRGGGGGVEVELTCCGEGGVVVMCVIHNPVLLHLVPRRITSPLYHSSKSCFLKTALQPASHNGPRPSKPVLCSSSKISAWVIAGGRGPIFMPMLCVEIMVEELGNLTLIGLLVGFM